MILRKSLFILILRQCQYRLVGGWICGDTHLLRRVIGEKLQSPARLITARQGCDNREKIRFLFFYHFNGIVKGIC